MATATTAGVEGKVIQIAGPTIDIQFPEGHIPLINNAIHVTSDGFDVPTPIRITCEVAQHIGEGRVLRHFTRDPDRCRHVKAVAGDVDRIID